ncbi:hypothetical protein QE152_g32134 [Popillia japonica]|uniref:Uncharacterized protein n=1 Tax=Popillia japonica TaxID=7064 RepID=A0AAW1J0F2_POPJA
MQNIFITSSGPQVYVCIGSRRCDLTVKGTGKGEVVNRHRRQRARPRVGFYGLLKTYPWRTKSRKDGAQEVQGTCQAEPDAVDKKEKKRDGEESRKAS